MNQKQLWEKQASADPIFAAITTKQQDYKDRLDHPIPFLVEADDKILELGCGWGRTLLPLTKRSKFVVGLDISYTMLAHVKKRGKKFGVLPNLVQADLAHLPFKPETFSIAFSTLVLMHVSQKQMTASLYEMHKILKKKGRLIVTLPNKNTTIGMISTFGRKLKWILGLSSTDAYVRYYTYSSLRLIFTKIYPHVTIKATQYRPLSYIPNTKIRIYNPNNPFFQRMSLWMEHRANAKYPLLKRFCQEFLILARK